MAHARDDDYFKKVDAMTDSAPQDVVELARTIVEAYTHERKITGAVEYALAQAVLKMHTASVHVDEWISEMEKEKHWLKQRLEKAEAQVTILRTALEDVNYRARRNRVITADVGMAKAAFDNIAAVTKAALSATPPTTPDTLQPIVEAAWDYAQVHGQPPETTIEEWNKLAHRLEQWKTAAHDEAKKVDGT